MNNNLIDQLRAANEAGVITHKDIAQALGRAQPAATRLLNGQRSLKADEVPKLEALLRSKDRPHPDLPPIVVEENSYVPVEVMPTYVGMGGGGNGDDDIETALVPRYLVEGVLRGHSEDFVLIRTRGDSMAPDFFHDDDVLCDRRDRSPTQPGPFALWHDDAYVLKNVERVPDGRVRIFSSNPKYTTVEMPTDQTRIIGRPVWVGRRL
jgi:phage repressor protein C with HTH and peptisase S24 domain